jgi:large subunit ribosomal protein L5
MNAMRTIRIEKVTLNVGAGKDQVKLEKGLKLLKMVTGAEPVKTVTMKRIPTWGLRPNLPIGCKVTIRKGTKELIRRLLYARDFKINESNFDNNGSISFGVLEYIDVEGLEYNHEIGMMGFEVSVTLERPGFRIKKRKFQTRKITRHHKITKEEAIAFMKENFNVKLGDDE